MTENLKIHIGTSGWHYRHWEDIFYPSELSKEDYLDYYCKHFQTVEINNSFYQLPDEHTLGEWRDATPGGFTFAVKASRYITHMKKLKNPQEPVSTFLERISILGGRLGPVLFQLPPNWRPNIERLREFLEMLPEDYQYAFEFRDERWFDERIFAALEEHQAALCIYHLKGRLSPKEITSDFVYIRLHGPDGAYQGKYTTNELSGWAGAISSWKLQGKEIYCYFDNDAEGFAPQNAASLEEMLEDV